MSLPPGSSCDLTDPSPVTSLGRRAMLSAAAAIGVVATFGTPIGGVLFSVEVTATYYMVSNLWRCFVGAISCIVCFQRFVDLEIISQVPPTVSDLL